MAHGRGRDRCVVEVEPSWGHSGSNGDLRNRRHVGNYGEGGARDIGNSIGLLLWGIGSGGTVVNWGKTRANRGNLIGFRVTRFIGLNSETNASLRVKGGHGDSWGRRHGDGR